MINIFSFISNLVAIKHTITPKTLNTNPIIINPKRAEACNNLGLILREQKEFEDALGLFFNAFTLNSNLEEISINISETLILYFTEEPQTALDIAKNWHQQSRQLRQPPPRSISNFSS